MAKKEKRYRFDDTTKQLVEKPPAPPAPSERAISYADMDARKREIAREIRELEAKLQALPAELRQLPVKIRELTAQLAEIDAAIESYFVAFPEKRPT